MRKQFLSFIFVFVVTSLFIGGCVHKPKFKDYSSYRKENIQSILVVPVINRSVDVEAPDYFLSTIAKPLAERGYYVFPVNMVKSVMEDDGLADANLVHSSDPTRLGELFGSDAILYVAIDAWDANYLVFSTEVIIKLDYSLKSAKTGVELWQNSETRTYSTNSDSNTIGLIIAAIHAAVTRAMPNHIELAQQANAHALLTPHQGIPAGPYHKLHNKDTDEF